MPVPRVRSGQSGRASRLFGALAAAVVVTLAALAPAAGASKSIRVGIYDDAQILYGNPDQVFPLLQQAGARVLRVNLWWGGTSGVARRKPADASDPSDPAYDWSTYDRTALYGRLFGIRVMFTILGTPAWANRNRGWNAAPTDPDSIQDFATAAATRYSGRFLGADGKVIPAVKFWVVWNEPNNPVFLKPQYIRERGRWVVKSARDYAIMCNAVVAGIRAGQKGGKVACGATAPRGNNNPNSSRPSVAPVAFLSAMRTAGASGFNAYAHHPYYGAKRETPTTPPPQGPRGNPATAITLGNFSTLVKAIDSTYGRRMRIWVTEYGYQTNPPDRLVGVSQSLQAKYMAEAYKILRDHPRVDLLIWFLLRDEERLEGWQSGLYTVKWKRKLSREVFEQIAAGRVPKV